MQAGKLRHRVTVEQPVETQNAYGEPVVTWTTFAEVWASIEPLTGREYFSAQQIMGEVTTRFRMQYLAGITDKMRIVKGDRIWNIKSVLNPEMRNRELQLMAVEVV